MFLSGHSCSRFNLHQSTLLSDPQFLKRFYLFLSGSSFPWGAQSAAPVPTTFPDTTNSFTLALQPDAQSVVYFASSTFPSTIWLPQP